MVVTTYNIVRLEGGVTSRRKGASSAVDHSKQVSLSAYKCGFVALLCVF
jgi:hypothetical protein